MGGILVRADRAAALGIAVVSGLAAVALSVAAALNVVAPGSLELDVPLDNLRTPSLGEGVDGVESATYSTAALTLTDVTSHERWLFGAASALGSLAAIIGVGTIAWLGWRIFRRTPFTRRLPLLIAASGVAVMVSGTIGSMLQAFGVHAVLDRLQLLPGTDDDSAFFLMELNLVPLAFGLGAAAVAGAFEAGYRLHRDTDGLV